MSTHDYYMICSAVRGPDIKGDAAIGCKVATWRFREIIFGSAYGYAGPLSRDEIESFVEHVQILNETPEGRHYLGHLAVGFDVLARVLDDEALTKECRAWARLINLVTVHAYTAPCEVQAAIDNLYRAQTNLLKPTLLEGIKAIFRRPRAIP